MTLTNTYLRIMDKGSNSKSPDDHWLQQLNQILEKNLSNDSIGIKDLAQAMNMSESTFLRKVKRLTGVTPIQYLQELRLIKGKQLLEQGNNYSISKIAWMVGYKDVRSFSRLFKKRFGYQPSQRKNT